MLRTSPTRSARNLPSDMIEDAEVGNRANSITLSVQNLSVSVDMAGDAKVGGGKSGNNETVKKLLLRS